MNPRQLTILLSVDDWACANKTFKVQDDQLVKLRDYHLGLQYKAVTYYLNPGHELQSLWGVLLKYEHNEQAFAIYGIPPDKEVFNRSAEGGVQDPGPVQLIRVDADNWETTLPWSYDDPEAIRRVVHEGLRVRGLGWLAAHDCLLMWSQSAWDTSVVNAHLYYWAEQGFTLEQLRQWANALRMQHGYKVLDGAVYRAVQPDYICARKIVEGEDFLTSETRYRYLTGRRDGTVEQLTFKEGILPTVKAQEGQRTAAGLTVDGFEVKGDAWEILKHCGKGDINEYAYKAAAKLVSDLGKRAVRANLGALAEQMHAAAWSVIVDNSEGARGSAKDRETYSIKRFRQYLSSACDNVKGGPDELVDQLAQALAQAEAGQFELLCDARTLQAFNRLRHNPSWLPLLLPLKRRMTARVMGMSYAEYRTLADRAQVTRADADGLLDADDETLQQDLSDATLYEALQQALELHRSPTGTVALVDVHDMRRRRDGGYRSRSVMDGLVGVLLAKAVELFPQATSMVALDRTVGSLAKIWINGVQDTPLTRPYVSWSHRTPDGVLWQNLGLQEGQYRCLRVDAERSTRMTWAESYTDASAPIWKHSSGVDTGTFKNGPHPFHQLDIQQGMEGRGAQQELWSRLLFEHIRVQSNLDEANIIGFIMGELLDAPNGMIMTLQGVTGSGKSHTAMRILDLIHPVPRELVDRHPHLYDRSMISNNEFLWSIAEHKAIGIDNMSGTMQGRQQDILCSVATGVRHRQRVLYTSNFLDYFVRCSIILTGISDVTSREDLGTRTVVVDVRDREEGEGYTDRDWINDRKVILEGLNGLACKILCLLAGTTQWGRNLLQDTAMRLYLGNQYEDLKKYEEVTAHAEGITRSPFAMAVAAYIMEQKLGLFGEERILATEFYDGFLAFANEHRGEVMQFRSVEGVNWSVACLPQRDKLYLPPNVKSFGINLMKHVNSISALTGRSIIRKRSRFGTEIAVKRFTKLDIV